MKRKQDALKDMDNYDVRIGVFDFISFNLFILKPQVPCNNFAEYEIYADKSDNPNLEY